MHLDRSDPEAWPFPAVTDHRLAGRDAWREISEACADEFLNVLPPIYCKGGFMVSEAADDDARGVPIYACVARAGGSYWMREVARDKADEAIQALKSALESAKAVQP